MCVNEYLFLGFFFCLFGLAVAFSLYFDRNIYDILIENLKKYSRKSELKFERGEFYY